jgi:hypothetical protein
MTPRTDSDQDTKCYSRATTPWSEQCLLWEILSTLSTGTLGGGGSFFLMAWASVVLL